MPLDFSAQNLQGRSFKGLDLTGANFSRADIRGANFTAATLVGANFSHAIAGVPRYWQILQGVMTVMRSLLSGFIAVIAGAIAGGVLSTSNLGINLAIVAISGIIFLKYRQKKTLLNGMWAIGVTVVGVIVGAVAIAIAFPQTEVGGSILDSVLSLAIASLMLLISALVFAIALIRVKNLAWVGAIGGFLMLITPLGWAKSLGVLTGAIFALFFGLDISQRALAGDQNFAFLPQIAVNFTTTKGTSFRLSDLTDADFTQAWLKNTDFTRANLTRTHFKAAFGLEQAKFDRRIPSESEEE